jgi:glyoxylase-like metal-dependent hydrolase (beta-lactamase superfamily II)
VGERRVAVIDPGPEAPAHVDALVAAVRDADEVSVVVTHGHPDHSPAARPLAEALGVDVWGLADIPSVNRPIDDGDVVPTDSGDLVAIATPGHARHHLSLHWPARRALFAGDLLLGAGNTVWVGEYVGSVADYLDSLVKVRALGLEVIYPAHGAPLERPVDAIDRFERHRRERIRQMEQTLAERPDATVEELRDSIYGTVLSDMARRAATLSLEALKAHVEAGRR